MKQRASSGQRGVKRVVEVATCPEGFRGAGSLSLSALQVDPPLPAAIALLPTLLAALAGEESEPQLRFLALQIMPVQSEPNWFGFSAPQSCWTSLGAILITRLDCF